MTTLIKQAGHNLIDSVESLINKIIKNPALVESAGFLAIGSISFGVIWLSISQIS